MLAIITKMTLTQVSTWFANARRRLKKENKMTWEPKNKATESRDNDDKDSCKSLDDDDDDTIDVKHSGEFTFPFSESLYRFLFSYVYCSLLLHLTNRKSSASVFFFLVKIPFVRTLEFIKN